MAMYSPGMVVSSGALPTLVVWVGTQAEYGTDGERVHDYLWREGYATTSWRDDGRTVLAVHLINKAGFETEAERDAVCRHIIAGVKKALVAKSEASESPANSGRPPELIKYRLGRWSAEYTVLVVCGRRVEEAEFVRNEHGWFCDRIGREFEWLYPIPDGGPERDGPQPPSKTPYEAAQTLMRKKWSNHNLYFRVLLDEFPAWAPPPTDQ